jgi:hypothetical protein
MQILNLDVQSKVMQWSGTSGEKIMRLRRGVDSWLESTSLRDYNNQKCECLETAEMRPRLFFQCLS